MENNLLEKSKNYKLWKILFILVSFFPISFLMKYVSETTHEFLGHCLAGLTVGGSSFNYYVSWIWPYEFGHAFVQFDLVVGNAARAYMMSGGIIACLIVAFSTQLIIYFTLRKNSKRHLVLIIFYHIFFWYGFWAFMNSIGYLIMGGIWDFGDIAGISNLTGIPSWIFIFPGIIFFVLLYYLISVNLYKIFKPFTNFENKYLLMIFWLLIPLIYLLVVLNPTMNVSTPFFIGGIFLMLLPSLFIFLTLHYKIKLWKAILLVKENSDTG